MSFFYGILKDIGGECPGEGGWALVTRVIVNIAGPFAVGIGVFSGVYAVETMGPLPSVFIGAGVIAALTYYVMLGIACSLKGKSFFLCPVAYAIKQVANMFTFGLSGAISKFVDKAADALLEITGGCGTDAGVGSPVCNQSDSAGQKVHDVWTLLEDPFKSQAELKKEWTAKCAAAKKSPSEACTCERLKAAGDL